MVTIAMVTIAMINLLLNGNHSFDFLINKKIAELTINFIILSKRFEVPFISND